LVNAHPWSLLPEGGDAHRLFRSYLILFEMEILLCQNDNAEVHPSFQIHDGLLFLLFQDLIECRVYIDIDAFAIFDFRDPLPSQ